MKAGSLKTGAVVMALAVMASVALADDAEKNTFVIKGVGHGAGHGAGHGGERMFFHGDSEGFDLAELLDGETRTFGTGEHQVTASRRGDVVTIDRPGDDDDAHLEITCDVTSDTCRVIEGADGGRTMLFIQKERMCEGGAEDCDMLILEHMGEGAMGEHGNIVVTRDIECKGDDEECENIEVLVKAIGVDGAFGEAHANVFVADDGSGLTWVNADQRTLRCPEGDTTMRVKKDEVDEVFLCPKHSKPLEEVKMRTRMMPHIEIRETDPHEH